jgi:hypothetical protein
MYGPWNDGSPAATSDVPTRPAPNINATLPNTSPVWKRRRVSEGNQGRRASKTTRACDACKVWPPLPYSNDYFTDISLTRLHRQRRHDALA